MAGEPFDVVLDLELADDAPTALIITVEPAPPLRLAGSGRSRAIVRPGEARGTWVSVVLPADTEPGERDLLVDVRAPGGTVLRCACTVEVRPAPAGDEVWAAGEVPTSVEPTSSEGVLDLRTTAPDAMIDLRAPEPPAPPVALAAETVDEPPPVDEFAALRATAHAPRRPRPRRSRTDRALFAVGVVLMLVAVAGGVVSAIADPAGDDARDDADADAPATAPVAGGEAGATPAAPRVGPDEGYAVIGSVVLDGGPDPATVTVTASVAGQRGGPQEVVAVADAEGRFRLRLPPGIHRLLVSAPGFIDTPQTVVVEEADVEVPPITLVPA